MGFFSYMIQGNGSYAFAQAHRVAKALRGTGWAFYLGEKLWSHVKQKYPKVIQNDNILGF